MAAKILSLRSIWFYFLSLLYCCTCLLTSTFSFLYITVIFIGFSQGYCQIVRNCMLFLLLHNILFLLWKNYHIVFHWFFLSTYTALSIKIASKSNWGQPLNLQQCMNLLFHESVGIFVVNILIVNAEESKVNPERHHAKTKVYKHGVRYGENLHSSSFHRVYIFLFRNVAVHWCLVLLKALDTWILRATYTWQRENLTHCVPVFTWQQSLSAISVYVASL